jgi:predicted DNA-binding transcriptional regulator AlpA
MQAYRESIMIKQYIVKDNLTLVDAKEVGIWQAFHQLVNQATQPTTDDNDIYIGIKELCARLSVARQSIYNKINTGILIEGIHFFKPTGGKLLFKWSAMLEWVERAGGKPLHPHNPQLQQISTPPNKQKHQDSIHLKQKSTNKDFINI